MTRTFARFALALVLAGGCRTATPPPAAAPAAAPPATSEASAILTNMPLGATLWQQTSVEYRALGVQAYTTAKRQLDAALADPLWTAALEQTGDASKLPPAIVLDVDETVIETAGYQAELLASGEQHTEARFTEYGNKATSPAIEGAVEFLNYAASKGVTVFYVTNRKTPAEEGTRRTLARLGLPLSSTVDTVIMRGERPEWEPGDKGPRRKSIARDYRILLLFGDDFNDFVTAYGMGVPERAAIFEQHRERFGTKWIILPNPAYGSWERALVAGQQRLTPEQELEIKRGFIHPDKP
ncbi:MAG: 5'-nucleotidase, lipoprotein e(P4) family [Thermoanaerobaculia bacterium]